MWVCERFTTFAFKSNLHCYFSSTFTFATADGKGFRNHFSLELNVSFTHLLFVSRSQTKMGWWKKTHTHIHWEQLCVLNDRFEWKRGIMTKYKKIRAKPQFWRQRKWKCDCKYLFIFVWENVACKDQKSFENQLQTNWTVYFIGNYADWNLMKIDFILRFQLHFHCITHIYDIYAHRKLKQNPPIFKILIENDVLVLCVCVSKFIIIKLIMIIRKVCRFTEMVFYF